MKLLRLIAIGVAATVALATQAHAATTATLNAASIAASPSPGCQPKGLWGSQVSTGSLASGTYRYAVTATTVPAQPACPSIEVVAGSNALVALQWNPSPAATGYTIYRGTSDANLAPLSAFPTSSCFSKCVFADTGALTPSGSVPVLASPSLLAGDHTDTSIAQTIDYGGTPNDNNDDPTTDNNLDSAPPALKTDVIHFPGGFTADALAAASCNVSDASGASLLGDTTLHGSTDPQEDTCPLASLVGSVQALIRTPSGVPLIQGDIYAGSPVSGESARFLIALRPQCSFHNPVLAPGSAACNAQLGANNQLDTIFLTLRANVVQRSPGVNGIDAELFDISSASDQPLPKTLSIRNSSGVTVAAITLQIRRMTPTLFGYAEQGTASTSDDKPFVTLPTCGTTEFSADKTTYADATGTTASTPFTSLAACPVPSTPTPTSSPAPAPKKKKCKKGRVRKHGKCVKKKRKR
jgi:hypothetical protein